MAYQLRKRKKLEQNFVDLRNLPDLVLIKIFSYLNFEDRCNAAYVCHRWYDISRSSVFWSQLQLKKKDVVHLLKSILILPPSVKDLILHCDSFDRYYSLWLPDIMTRLHERCPGIKSLIIENVFFAARFCNTRLTTDHVLLHSFETAGERSHYRHAPRCVKECCSEKINSDKYVPKNCPQELSIFSLRYAHCYKSHLSSKISEFLPNVKVLDLTSTATIKPAAIPFFLKLKYLEELYLVECTVSNYALKSLLQHLKYLKVLDLEGSNGIDDNSFLIIKKYGDSLEQLFLGNTSITTLHSFTLDVNSFPKLQTICLRNTAIIDTDVSVLMDCLQKLKYIDVSFCNFFGLFFLRVEAVFNGKEFYCTYEGNCSELCHHFKIKYM